MMTIAKVVFGVFGTFGRRLTMQRLALFISMLILFPPFMFSAILRVGPDKPYKTVRAAAAATKDGDIVEIDRGTYPKDVATWRSNDVTVRSVGGRAHLRAGGASESGKGIWVVQGHNFTAEGIEFSEAAVSDRNGAGIRAQGTGLLTIRNCYFHDNQEGILGPNDKDAEVLIENSIFENNGYGDGQSHNIYIGPVKRFTIQASYIHKARIGHNIKSRARTNHVLYNRIMDEDTGTASYQVDISEGGDAFIIGNVIQQGPRAENYGIISYAAENSNAGSLNLFVINNTLVNERVNGSLFLQMRSGTKARVHNNIFYGRGETWKSGTSTTVIATNNYREPRDNNSPRFANPQAFDYRISRKSPCRNTGTDPGIANGFSLKPASQYVYDAGSRERIIIDNIDVGAFESSDLDY